MAIVKFCFSYLWHFPLLEPCRTTGLTSVPNVSLTNWRNQGTCVKLSGVCDYVLALGSLHCDDRHRHTASETLREGPREPSEQASQGMPMLTEVWDSLLQGFGPFVFCHTGCTGLRVHSLISLHAEYLRGRCAHWSPSGSWPLLSVALGLIWLIYNLLA